ncbi:MAG TPA: VOC family protein [Candidatus Acidoferrales bacterium]
MAKLNQSEQFDRFLTALLAGSEAPLPNSGSVLAGAAAIAAELRGLPREDFKSALKSKLQGGPAMASKPVTAPVREDANTEVPVAAQQQITATTFLILKSAARAIEFYKQAFGAIEVMRLNMPGDRVGFAQLRIGGAEIMLADESPAYGSVSAETLGGSPFYVHLSVPDADAFAARAVAAGAKILRPVTDQFYGARSGTITDPFGFHWQIATPTEQVSAEEMQRRFNKLVNPATAAEEPKFSLPVPYMRQGFRSLTPYLLAPKAAELIEFYKNAFGAEELFRVARPGSDLIMHAELRINDSMVELADATAEFKARASTNILYVPDVDAAYERSVKAGAASIYAPMDQSYGDRESVVKDPGGNLWCLSSRGTGSHITPDTPSIVPMFTVHGADKYLDFLKQAFGAREIGVFKNPEGVIDHARLRIGNSVIAGSEAHGDYQSAPFLLHLYVQDTDETYARALAAGATSVRGLEDAPYGDRTATVADFAGNLWSLATHLRDVKF